MGEGKPRDENLYFELIEQGEVDSLRRLVADRPELLLARTLPRIAPEPPLGCTNCWIGTPPWRTTIPRSSALSAGPRSATRSPPPRS